jgi:nucleotide-binding universal stress UspA family protein
MAQTIVVGTDGSEPAERAVREAIDIAARDGARLHIVTAYPDPAMVLRERITSGATRMDVNLRDVADSVVARHERDAEERGVQVVTHARESNPAEAILEVANEQNADLIVVGTGA